MPHMTVLDHLGNLRRVQGGLGDSNTPHSLRLDLSGFKRKNCNSLVTTRDDTDENLYMYSVGFFILTSIHTPYHLYLLL